MSDQQFVDSLQKGRGRHGMFLYPAMPYTYTARVTRQDALDIRAYLATLAPVHNPVVEDQLPFPFSIRVLMGVWDWLFFKEGTFKPDPHQSPEWNRGAYLVQGLAHCGMCHTPKNFLGGDESGSALQGYALQGWFAPDITENRRRGLATWSVEDIVAYLRSGHNRIAGAAGPMGEEVAIASQNMTESDLRAIAVYLKSLPAPQEGNGGSAPSRGQLQAGAAIYGDRCSACHGANGEGVPNLFPALAGSGQAQERNPASTLRVILAGVRSVGTRQAPTAPGMPSFAWELSDPQIAAVATYIRNAWGNSAPAVSPGDVSAARASLSPGKLAAASAQ